MSDDLSYYEFMKLLNKMRDDYDWCGKRIAVLESALKERDAKIAELEERWDARNVLLLAIAKFSWGVLSPRAFDGQEVVRLRIADLEAALVAEREKSRSH